MDREKDRHSESGDLPKAAEAHVEDSQTIESAQDVDTSLDKRIDRKFDYHIVPWIFGIW